MSLVFACLSAIDRAPTSHTYFKEENIWLANTIYL
jgi:hypothetical protein